MFRLDDWQHTLADQYSRGFAAHARIRARDTLPIAATGTFIRWERPTFLPTLPEMLATTRALDDRVFQDPIEHDRDLILSAYEWAERLERDVDASGAEICRRGVSRFLSHRKNRLSSQLKHHLGVPHRIPSLLDLNIESGQPEVSIIIPFRDEIELTLEALASVVVTTAGLPVEVILIDDASIGDHTKLFEQCRGIRYARNEANLGFGGAANRGAAMSDAEFLVFLNNDVICKPFWLEELLYPLRQDAKVGVVGSMVLRPDGYVEQAGAHIRPDGVPEHRGSGWTADDPALLFRCDVDYVSGCCMATRRRLFEDVGSFDPLFAPAYYEDTDYCTTVRDRGFQVQCAPQSVVVHLGSQSYNKDRSSLRETLMARNSVRFREKWKHKFEPTLGDGSYGDSSRHWRDEASKVSIVVIDQAIPTPLEDSGSMRCVEMLRHFIASGHRVLFIPQNGFMSAHSVPLQRLGIRVFPSIEYMQAHEGIVPTAVMVIRPETMLDMFLKVRLAFPNTPLLYDSVDVHFKRFEALVNAGDEYAVHKVDTYKHMERFACSVADLVIAVSLDEEIVLQEELGAGRTCTVPNIHHARHVAPPLSGRRHYVFVGGFNHTPNIAAATRLAYDILPRARKLDPQLEILIVGSHPPNEILALDGLPGVRVVGYVEDIVGLLDSAVGLVAPLTWGAGLKGKVTQALSIGLPVITNEIGIQGINGRRDVDYIHAESDIDFAAEMVKLQRDDNLWAELSKNGMALAQRQFSVKAAMAGIDGFLESVQVRPVAPDTALVNGKKHGASVPSYEDVKNIFVAKRS